MIDDFIFDIDEGEEVAFECDGLICPHHDLESERIIQTLDLKAGWNLVSFYVETGDMAPATVLAPIDEYLVQIKSLTQSYHPSVSSFLNSLTSLNVSDGYWLKVTEDVSFEIEGEVPAGVSIAVKEGWNLLGYPKENGVALADELNSLDSTLLQIKNLTDSYDPQLPEFLNTLTTMTPGLGYWLQVGQNGP